MATGAHGLIVGGISAHGLNDIVGRYLKQGSDIASVAFWYQMEPHASFPRLPVKDDLEVR